MIKWVAYNFFLTSWLCLIDIWLWWNKQVGAIVFEDFNAWLHFSHKANDFFLTLACINYKSFLFIWCQFWTLIFSPKNKYFATNLMRGIFNEIMPNNFRMNRYANNKSQFWLLIRRLSVDIVFYFFLKVYETMSAC